MKKLFILLSVLAVAGIGGYWFLGTDADSYMKDAAFYTQKKEYKSALAVLEKAQIRYSELPIVYLNKAKVYVHLKQPKKAIDELNHAIKLGMAEIKTWPTLVSIYLQQEKREDAFELLNKLLEKESKNIGGLLQRAHLYLTQKKLEEAWKDFSTVLSIQPKNLFAQKGKAQIAEIYMLQAIEHLAKKEEDKAHKIMNILSSWEGSKLNYDYLLATELYINQKYFKAEKVLLKITKKYKEKTAPRINFLLGIIQVKLAKYADAIETLKPLYAAAPEHPRIIELLVYSNDKLEDYDAVVDIIEALPKEKQTPKLLMLAAKAAERLHKKTKTGQYIEQAESLLPKEALASAEVTRTKLYAISELVQDKKYKEALYKIRSLKDKNPASPLSYFLEGGVYLSQRKFKKAKKAFSTSLRKKADFWPALQKLAVIAIVEKDLDAAVHFYKRALKIRPDMNTHISLARIKIAQKKTDEALNELKQALKINPSSIEGNLFLAQYALDHQNIEQANQQLANISEINQHDPRVLLFRAKMASKLKDFTQAEKYYQQLVRRLPKSANAKYRLAQVQFQLGQYKEVRQNLKTAMSLEPDNDLIYRTALVMLEIKQKNYEKAIDFAKQLQFKYPKYSQPYVLAAKALKAQGKFSDGIKMLEKAIKLTDSTENITELAFLYVREGNTTKAINLLNTWLKKYPGDSGSLSTRGLIYQQIGQKEKAFEDYQKSIHIYDKNPIILNNIAFLYQEKNQLLKALEFSKKAYQLASNSFAIIDTYGWILSQNKKYKEALPLLEKAYKLSPQNNEIGYHLAETLFHLKNTTEAQKILKNIIQQNPDDKKAKVLLNKIK